jgi:hypothetical protein
VARFIEDYNETESLYLFKSHHCLADGMALISMIINCQDDFKPE